MSIQRSTLRLDSETSAKLGIQDQWTFHTTTEESPIYENESETEYAERIRGCVIVPQILEHVSRHSTSDRSSWNGPLVGNLIAHLELYITDIEN